MKTSKILLVIALFVSAFYANAQITVDASGNVGIGTTTPLYKFHTEGDIYANGGHLRVSGSNGLYFQSYGGGFYMSDATWIRIKNNKNIYQYSGILRTDGTFQCGANGSRFIITTGGNVGINLTTPEYKLDVEGGQIRVEGTIYYSDARFKENIEDIGINLTNIKQLRPVKYDMKTWENRMPGNEKKQLKANDPSLTVINGVAEDSLCLGIQNENATVGEEVQQTESEESNQEFYKRKHMGFVAQEMEEIFPEIVYTDKKGYKSIDYVALIPVLVAGMKEQQEQIEKQQQLIGKLQEEIEGLKK